MPLSRAHVVIIALIAASVVLGSAIVYWQPRWPLLAYWLAVAMLLGMIISLTGSLIGIRSRAKWLITTFAVLIGFALATTQLAARRTISTTHLTYRGVHLAAVDSFTIGAGNVQADVQLQTITPSQVPWLLQLARADSGWGIAAVQGVEQVRISRPDASDTRDFAVAHSGVLQNDGDMVVVVDPAGESVDTLRLDDGALRSSRGSTFSLETRNDAIRRRYQRRLRTGAPLSMLEGERTAADVYERFIRVQRIGPRDVVNGVPSSLLARLLGRDRLLVSATPPYRLAGDLVAHDRLTVNDSATVEVRNGDGTWRFVLHTSWRREPSADPGVSIVFQRNPRPLDTPLPVGVSCQAGVACGAISLRRLPPPIAHIALDHAGFDPERYGLLGTLRETDAGYSVVLPRETYAVERERPRPVAVPVVDLSQPLEGDDAARPTRWVLLGAAGQGEDAVMILGIALGLGLLLTGIYRTVAAVSSRLNAHVSRRHERAMMVGVTAILALLLARITLGARVAFFEPFLETGVDTAVGMFVAIAVVAVGLLSWPEWLPPLLMGARGTLTGQRSFRGLVQGIARFFERVAARVGSAEALITAALVLGSLLLLAYFTDAVWYGMLAGVAVLLAWLCIAWIAAFTGPHFETYEKGAHAVVELLPAASTIDRPDGATATNWATRLLRGAPELYLIVACVVVELAHILPRLALLAGIAVMLSIVPVVRRRRQQSHRAQQPDYFAAAAAVAAFMTCVAVLRLLSESGSMGIFLLVVFVALASVRIGRSFGARLDAPRPISPRRSVLESFLLLAPLLFLLPLAGIDMGLFLVMVIPLGFATLLAVGVRTARWRVIPLVLAMLLVLVVGRKVVFPSVQSIADADSHAAQAEAYANMSKVFGMRLPVLSTPMDRAAARSVATADRELAEALLVAAGPGAARDLLIPSIEQIWGAKAYANAGWFGEGLGRAVVGGRGVAEAVSYAENTFSVFVLAEHGALGGMLVLALYALLLGAIAFIVRGNTTDIPSYRASRALFVVAGLIIAFPAVYVALSNIGWVPITGQNMPFLGLNAWSDVTICAGVVGILITGALRGLEEARR